MQTIPTDVGSRRKARIETFRRQALIKPTLPGAIPAPFRPPATRRGASFYPQRTAEGWAQGRPLPIAAAYQIAEALAYLPPK